MGRTRGSAIVPVLAYGDAVPTGNFLGTATKLPILDRSRDPTLVIRGEYDAIATDVRSTSSAA